VIVMNDFRRHVGALRSELQAAFDRVLDSGWFVLGREVESFEREWASFIGVPHAVGVASGLDALWLTLESLGVGAGDEVITTPNSAFATTLAIVRCGATPVFVDLDERTGALDVRRVKERVGARTRAIVPVHIYGHPIDLDPLLATGAPIVGDACQAHGARHGGRDVGSYGIASAYSFYPTKNLGCLGDGGMVVTSDAELAARVRRARDYGQATRYQHVDAGHNSRLDELQAALLRAKLPRLRDWNLRRAAIARRYLDGLAGLPLTLPEVADHDQSVWHLFTVRCGSRDALAAHLRARDIQSLIHYPTPIHLQPAMQRFGHRAGDFPIAERWAAEVLSLPISPELEDAEVDAVVRATREFFAA
jgi:dTDP-3-amino-3,4,6-trideoxy-alpha-D-glucose transaminase